MQAYIRAIAAICEIQCFQIRTGRVTFLAHPCEVFIVADCSNGVLNRLNGLVDMQYKSADERVAVRSFTFLQYVNHRGISLEAGVDIAVHLPLVCRQFGCTNSSANLRQLRRVEYGHLHLITYTVTSAVNCIRHNVGQGEHLCIVFVENAGALQRPSLVTPCIRCRFTNRIGEHC